MKNSVYKFNYSVIIPHFNIIDLLGRCLRSIPDRADIQIIVVDDNSGIDISLFEKLDIFTLAECNFIMTTESKGAGYARNAGLTKAEGKWLLFADADDFYEDTAFDIFDDYKDSVFDLIYFNTISRDSETMKVSNRNMLYNKIIERGSSDDRYMNWVKFGTRVPYGKLIRRSLVMEKGILFDEVKYANDIMFSTQVAASVDRILVDKRTVYCVTERFDSLVKQTSAFAAITRYRVILQVNRYLRLMGYKQYQNSLLPYIKEAFHGGIKSLLACFWLCVRYNALNRYSLFLTSREMRMLLCPKY